MSKFQKAVKTQAKLRLAIEGGPGTGKTFTGLRIARGLVDSRIAVVDTEAGSASKYADLFEFDTLVLTSYEPQDYIQAIADAEEAGYEVVILDSLSHEWQAVKDDVDRRKKGMRNEFAAWKEPKAAHNRLIERILQSRLHVIATMRSKVEYALDNSSGRAEVKRLGMAPIQQEEAPYNFDVVLELDQSHNGTVTKSRIAALADKIIEKPGEELGKKLRAWLSEGAPAPEPVAQPAEAPASANGQAAGWLPGAQTPITDDQRGRIEGLRAIAHEAVERGDEKAKAALAEVRTAMAAWHFKGPNDLYERGTGPQAEEVIRLLSGVADEVPA